MNNLSNNIKYHLQNELKFRDNSDFHISLSLYCILIRIYGKKTTLLLDKGFDEMEEIYMDRFGDQIKFNL